MEDDIIYTLLDAFPSFSTLIIIVIIFLFMKNMVKIVRQSRSNDDRKTRILQ